MIRFAIRPLALAILVALVSSAPARAVQLWGINATTNQIVRVDPLTGATFGGFTAPGAALVATQQFGGLTIAEQGAVLLYQNPVGNPTDLYRLDPDTGALLSTEFMPPAGFADFRAGLSFASDAGAGGADAIFAINNGAPVQRQDGYGDATLTDHTPSGATLAGALGGDDNGRQFLAIGGNQILEFSETTPNVAINTLTYARPFSLPVTGLAFDGERIYLSAFDGHLLTIDPDTGDVLNSVVTTGARLIGLAARGVPEPSSALLAGFAMCCLVRCRSARGPARGLGL